MTIKWVVALPIIIKGSAYVLLGAGSMANALGHADLSATLLGIAALFGLGDTARSAQQQ